MIKHPISTTFSGPARGACLLVLSLALGCQSSNSPSTSTTATDQIKPAFTVIRRGHPPMSVVVTIPGRLQVFDLSDDHNAPIEKMLLDTKIAANTIITLNVATGVTINAKPTKAKGPLSFKHTYEFRFFKQ